MNPYRRRMIEDTRIRNHAPAIQHSYSNYVSRSARHFGRLPELLGSDEIRTRQLHLCEDKPMAASTILASVSALRFPYKVTLRQDWNVDEVIPPVTSPRRFRSYSAARSSASFLARSS